ncbi:formate C-acetyltransferase [bacterium]|nr:formate C-acetyltransferase [bacterium]NCQ55121.1 formate C-acetyltransferase [Candidatus Parcubacteria bacterium]NCS67366.1 formate C-acetyltransferase [Candidatus Peregrinibacteria bacterium]NCS96621.1 formate C-acetyltransferase [bacterium]
MKESVYIDVGSYIQKHYLPYEGDGLFLAPATHRTKDLKKQLEALQTEERKRGGVLDLDAETPATITSHKPGYLDQAQEIIVGLQADSPLKRAIKPKGGIRMVDNACSSYNQNLNPDVKWAYENFVTTHNDGVFGLYKHWEKFHTPDGKLLRSKSLITGLPDNYGRGRIIGDYRRVALYGIDQLIKDKQKYLDEKISFPDSSNLQLREEIGWQIQALQDLKTMAKSYGFDISAPAQNFTQAVQWLYFGYLAAVKEQDGAAMSLGRIDAFLDIFAEQELQSGTMTESEIQEIIDDFVIKLRLVKQLRVPEYNEIFAGDPTWITLALGGMAQDGRTLVTKTTFRFLHTLKNLDTSPEPNLTVLWSERLPENFKAYVSQVAIDTSALQFENDDIMRPEFKDDYAIACCVSAMKVGQQMQYFGARCNLAKLLLLILNEGRDELDGSPIIPDMSPLKDQNLLNYDEVSARLFQYMDWVAERYVGTMNLIHYSHDRYYYENSQMALHDTEVERLMAFGIAGFSVLVDSLSAIKHAKVKPVRNQEGLTIDFKVTGNFPTYGTDDDRVDDIAIEVVKKFHQALKKYPTYRNAQHTLSVLTITSNVMYGSKTGATPDGRKSGEAFAPGANPMHNRDRLGAIASLNSVAKLPYEYCADGISNTFSITPEGLGKDNTLRVQNLKALLDGYFQQKAHHLNVNVLNEDTLRDAMKKPETYSNLTIRVSGYAVRFVSLSLSQQEEVLSRTFHGQT